MLLSLRKNGLTSLFKEVRPFSRKLPRGNFNLAAQPRNYPLRKAVCDLRLKQDWAWWEANGRGQVWGYFCREAIVGLFLPRGNDLPLSDHWAGPREYHDPPTPPNLCPTLNNPKNLLRLFLPWKLLSFSEVIYKDPPKIPFKTSTEITSRGYFKILRLFFASRGYFLKASKDS